MEHRIVQALEAEAPGLAGLAGGGGDCLEALAVGRVAASQRAQVAVHGLPAVPLRRMQGAVGLW